jgi:hypothetical protein
MGIDTRWFGLGQGLQHPMFYVVATWQHLPAEVCHRVWGSSMPTFHMQLDVQQGSAGPLTGDTW